MAMLAAFIVIVYRLQPRVRDVISARVALLGFQGAVSEVTRLADGQDGGAAAGAARTTPVFQCAIKFEGVTFNYTDQEMPALQDFSLEITSGSTVAIVGASGAGKSTLLDLLLGFREPQRGRVTIDSIPMNNLNLVAWRSRIGVVSQDPYIFDETIRFNILYGSPAAPDGEVEKSAELAYAQDFIRALPQGYETIVGERGVRLSGGQRQRLVLARALIRNPDLLILDEATNALDIITEHAFQQALSRFAGHRTIITVAHRLATIERADNIIVLDRGRLVEQGTFSNLVTRNGLFARMYELQSFTQSPNDADPAISIN
jgi:ABC-type multidrug transport system fused ATPase/permease subunit